MEFVELVRLAARCFEVAGVGAMVLGSLLAAVNVAVHRGRSARHTYRKLRQSLGAAILLGLELLVAADIIRTVAEAPTLGQVLVLGLIVLIRTFLSFTLAVELDGRWPWQGDPMATSEPREAEREEPKAVPPTR
ncbi:DUF1622 domain-containing protein [Corallococcus sp. CA053C]|uniref:DUF1622 domain-containing protein n=1 Tax=Corallococcus sp. CA053C TaxID=2316732 RepID=UPI000EA17D49|nr:DUF1622 domain-containing protein [Corallococcus sp. CA053C]RKH12384.1 DUF1622 domain-containing protein [Corallococcus sp. CA053C]